MTEEQLYILIFNIGKKRFGIDIQIIDRIIRSVYVTNIPDSVANIKGVIDLHGEIIPVVDLYHRFGIREKEISETDRFIILNEKNRKAAIIVEEVNMTKMPEADEIFEIEIHKPHTESTSGINISNKKIKVFKDQEGIVFLLDRQYSYDFFEEIN